MVQNGANIDARNGGSETALHAMIRRSKFDCVIGLLAKGASAAVKGVGGDSALHMAIEVVTVSITDYINILLYTVLATSITAKIVAGNGTCSGTQYGVHASL